MQPFIELVFFQSKQHLYSSTSTIGGLSSGGFKVRKTMEVSRKRFSFEQSEDSALGIEKASRRCDEAVG